MLNANVCVWGGGVGAVIIGSWMFSGCEDCLGRAIRNVKEYADRGQHLYSIPKLLCSQITK